MHTPCILGERSSFDEPNPVACLYVKSWALSDLPVKIIYGLIDSLSIFFFIESGNCSTFLRTFSSILEICFVCCILVRLIDWEKLKIFRSLICTDIAHSLYVSVTHGQGLWVDEVVHDDLIGEGRIVVVNIAGDAGVLAWVIGVFPLSICLYPESSFPVLVFGAWHCPVELQLDWFVIGLLRQD